MTIQLSVPGTPTPQGRPRCRCIKKADGSATPSMRSEKSAWREAVRRHAAYMRKEIGGPLTLPCSLIVIFEFQRPKSHCRSGRFAHLLRPDAPRFHRVKPDGDNVAKALADGIKDGGLIEDDTQIYDWRIIKRYGPEAKTLVLLEEVEAEFFTEQELREME